MNASQINEYPTNVKNKAISEFEIWITQAKKLTNQIIDSLESKTEETEVEELPQLSLESKTETEETEEEELPHLSLESKTEIEKTEAEELPQLSLETDTEETEESPQFILEMTEIRIFQPPTLKTEKQNLVDIKTRKFLGSIRKDEFFTIEVSFQVAGVEVADMANKHITYNVQCQARHRTTGAITTLDYTTPQILVQGKNSYTIMLPAIRLPLGLYRLRILVMLQGILAIPAYFEVPLLPVV